MSRSNRPSRPARRFGYIVAILCNLVGLYIVNHLLDWGWPRFLTDSFEDVLPLVNLSIVAGIATNALFIIGDARWFRSLCGVVTAGISVVVAVRTWQVFPFDFATYARDWSPLVRVIIVLAIVGSASAVVANAVRIVIPPHRPPPVGAATQ